MVKATTRFYIFLIAQKNEHDAMKQPHKRQQQGGKNKRLKMKGKKLEILVVEDREENRKAAQEYFSTRDDVSVDFATNYEEAIKKLDGEMYAAAILDIEFPRTKGASPKRLGLELGKELDVVKGKYRVPHVFLSGGYFHHDNPCARVFLDGVCVEKGMGGTTVDKTFPKAWRDAYEKLLEVCPNIDEIATSKERYQKFTGKPYRNK